MSALDEYYALMIDLIKRSGTLAMEGYNLKEQTISSKHGDWDLVTYYDGAIEKLIIDEIKLKYPSHKYINN